MAGTLDAFWTNTDACPTLVPSPTERGAMKHPGPDHPITIAPFTGRVVVSLAGVPLVDTTDALVLREARLPPVYYLPRADAEMGFFARTPHRTHCPYKGDASYHTLHAGGRMAENAVWSYEDPFPAMAAITGRLAFYPDRVDIVVEPA